MIEINLNKKMQTSKGILDLSLDFTVEKGDFITIFGKSGSGKTTLLKMLSGLTKPDEGKIIVNGITLYDSQKKINIKTQNRKIGYVFQDFALFPNMTVKENLLYAKNDKILINQLLEIMELNLLKDCFPDNLSGGQKQRVALARTLALKPDILLLDEPFSSLDIEMRHKLQDEILRVHKLFNVTILLVSHDISEVYRLSKRVIVIENGSIIKDGKPSDIFSNQYTSHKFSAVGELIELKKIDIIFIGIINLGNTICEIMLTEDDVKEIKIGDKVLVASKSFNPIVKKIPII